VVFLSRFRKAERAFIASAFRVNKSSRAAKIRCRYSIQSLLDLRQLGRIRCAEYWASIDMDMDDMVVWPIEAN
jgi:hypothetical protein